MRRSLGFTLVLAGLLSACGGGGGGSASGVVPNLGGGGTSPKAAQATITIVRPAAQSQSRSAKFIPSSAQSIRVHVLSVNGVPPDYNFFTDVIIALSTLNPACTTLSNGGLSCSVTVKVPQSPGVVLQISAYNSVDGSGTAVAVVTTPPVDTTAANPVFTASLGGVPAHILTSASVLSGPVDGAKHTLTFNVWATDSSNNIILPPGNYPTPITVGTSGDSGGALSPVTTAVASPGPTAGQSTVSVAYDSSKPLTTANITLASGSLSTNVQVNAMMLSPTSLNMFTPGASTAISVSEANYSGVYTLKGNGSNFSFVCAPSNCTPSSPGGSVTFLITSQANGTGTFTIGDAVSATANIPFTITGQTLGSINIANYRVITYALPAGAGSGPLGISAGPDGKSVWFAESGAGNIGRVDVTSCVDSANPPTCGILEQSTSGPAPWDIAPGSDGNMYATSPVGSTILQIAPSAACTPAAGPMNCVIMPLSMPTSAPGPTNIVRSADGNDYVTDVTPTTANIFTVNAGSVGSLFGTVPNPVLTPTPPPARSQPIPQYAGVAVTGVPANVIGAHPNLWVADNASSMLATINKPYQFYGGSWNLCTDCGGYDLYEVGGFLTGSGKTFGGLSFGPDGNLYVVEQAANSIAIVNTANCPIYPLSTTPSCTGVSQLPIPTANAGAGAIIAGPDGNMWFVESNANKIGILVLSTHVIHEIPISGTSVNPMGLTVGPDGSVWFTGNGNGTIGKVVL